MTPKAQLILDQLLEGNLRFRTGESRHYDYQPETISHLADNQRPMAAIVACSDGRVGPDVIFNQPLGKLFVSRVPGNVASDSAKWMLEIAVADLHVPLVMVLGHTRCLAVGQVLDGQISGPGGMLRYQIATAVTRARSKGEGDLYRACIGENAMHTAEVLRMESSTLRRALDSGQTSIVAGLYDVHTGAVEILPEQP